MIPIKELLHRMQEDGYEGMLTVEYASPAEIHGSEHIEMARVYVDYITECLEGEPFQTQYGNIDGIEKPVSRMFFGTAIEPMLAVERKAKNVLLVPGFVQKEETEKTQQLIENMQTGLRHAVEYGKEKQIDVSIEDFDALMAPYCRIAVIADFLEKVPGLKFSFDTGNFVMYHENELEAFELFRDKICTVHLKDRCRESEKTLSVWKETAGKNLCTVCANGEKLYVVPVGEGFMQIREIMIRLKKSGYDDGFIAELYNYPPEHMAEGIRKSIRWIKETWESIDCR